MKKTTSGSEEVWHVDSEASNHVMSHEEWFSYLEEPEQLGVVETGDDTPHPVDHVGEVPLSHIRQRGKLMNVFTCFDNNKEPGVDRADPRPRDAHVIYALQVLNRGRRPNYCARAQGREDVYPQYQ